MGIGVDVKTGNIYVADSGNERIQKFSNTGGFITKWGGLGTANGQFDNPSRVAVDSGGNVFVSDSNNNRIQKFNSDGKFIRKWGSEGTANGQFSFPEGIGINLKSGNIYVADTGNNRIQEFTNTGGFIRSWGSVGSASVDSIESTEPVQSLKEQVNPFAG